MTYLNLLISVIGESFSPLNQQKTEHYEKTENLPRTRKYHRKQS